MNQDALQFGEGNEYLSLEFARCQRPDGSYYGTGGVCRKGAPVGAKEKKELQAKAARGDKAAMSKLKELRASGAIGKEKGFEPGAKAKEDAKETKEALKKVKIMTKEQVSKASDAQLKSQIENANKAGLGKGASNSSAVMKGLKEQHDMAKAEQASRQSGGGLKTQAQAQSARRAAVVQALEKEKLPTNPVQMKAAVTRAMNKSEKGRSAQENVDVKKAAVDNARAKTKAAAENVKGKSGAERTAALKTYNKAQSDLNKKGTALDKAQGQLARLRKSEQRQIERKASQVAARAQRIARNKEPKVQDVMGATQRLGDTPIQP